MKKIMILICALFGLAANSLTDDQKIMIFAYTTIEFFAEHCSDEYKDLKYGVRDSIDSIITRTDEVSKYSSIFEKDYKDKIKKIGQKRWCNGVYKEINFMLESEFSKK